MPASASPLPFLWAQHDGQKQPKGVPQDRSEFFQAEVYFWIWVGVVAVTE
jgi:hypothetical protein